MKKLILSLVLCLNLAHVPTKPIFIEKNQINSLNYNNKSITNYSYDPTYPNFNFCADSYSKLKRLYIDSSKDSSLPSHSGSLDRTYSKVGNGSWYNFEWNIKTINILQYAPNKQVFLEHYGRGEK